jgi:flagellar biosynthesis anti-sigma factor FlgM
MIIGDKAAASIGKLYSQRIQPPETRQVEKPAGGAAEAEGDQIEISAEALALQQTHDAVEADEAGRAERVAQLREAVAKGEYEVPVEELAQRLIADV